LQFENIRLIAYVDSALAGFHYVVLVSLVTDEIEKTGLIGGAEKRRVEIVDYDPDWPKEFERHRRIIARALGNTAQRIEHIGSTSVPGLAAKPIVDILVVVEDSTEESAYLPQLEAAGYELRVREPQWHEHRMFRTPERDVHIHFYSAGCAEIQRNLIFRDRLRQNTADRLRYEQIKRELATRDWSDVNDYATAKTDVIESIIAAAESDSG
jgi:GrpB-like predicted nucleotidyltransferase (UPF0157 family)